MPKYRVAVPFTGVIYVEVDAENTEEAKENALTSAPSIDKPEADVEYELHNVVCKGNVFYGVLNEIYVEDP